jgi:hypothetical protein
LQIKKVKNHRNKSAKTINRLVCKKNTMTTFKSTFEKYNWDEIQSNLCQYLKQVEQALAKSKRDLDDFLALISPAAQPT